MNQEGNNPIMEQKLEDSGKNTNNTPGVVDYLDGLFGIQE